MQNLCIDFFPWNCTQNDYIIFFIFTELAYEMDWKNDEIKDRFSAWNYYSKYYM